LSALSTPSIPAKHSSVSCNNSLVLAVDADELVDATGVERNHLRLQPRPADGLHQVRVGEVTTDDGLGRVAHGREDDRARVDHSAVEIEEDNRKAHGADRSHRRH